MYVGYTLFFSLGLEASLSGRPSCFGFWLLLQALCRRESTTGGIGTPKGPSTEYLKFLVPNTIPPIAFGTRGQQIWVLIDPLGKLMGRPAWW